MKVVGFNPRAAPSHRRLPLSILMAMRGLAPGWRLVDGNLDPASERTVAAECARGRVLLLVTVMPGPQLRVATPLCRTLKAANPELVVVWGGYFPSVHTDACLADPGVDGVVVGQGEVVLPALVAALSTGADPSGLPGLSWKGAGGVVRGPATATVRSSDFGPLDYRALPMDTYAARTFLGERTFNHHTSVGCPYLCNFCAVVNLFEGRWIPDPAESVVATVRELVTTYGADAIEFHDNNFFAWERRCREVADGLSGMGVRWWGEGRIDTMLGFSEDTWSAMARSGLAMVFFGAESGDDEALDRMDKGGLRVDDTRALNRVARRHGVVPEFSFVLGNASDPERDVALSLELIRELKRDNPACEVILYLYTPVPLPGQWDEARARGFSFPTTLDGWLSPPWTSFDHRKVESTPWMTPALRRRVDDFEVVLNARFPTATDLNLGPVRRRVVQALAAPRWSSRAFAAPFELRALLRALRYRRPEEMGF